MPVFVYCIIEMSIACISSINGKNEVELFGLLIQILTIKLRNLSNQINDQKPVFAILFQLSVLEKITLSHLNIPK